MELGSEKVNNLGADLNGSSAFFCAYRLIVQTLYGIFNEMLEDEFHYYEFISQFIANKIDIYYIIHKYEK
ncbi:hypothetical protein LSPH24S_05954 [Lysinibacillus sphaericus]